MIFRLAAMLISNRERLRALAIHGVERDTERYGFEEYIDRGQGTEGFVGRRAERELLFSVLMMMLNEVLAAFY